MRTFLIIGAVLLVLVFLAVIFDEPQPAPQPAPKPKSNPKPQPKPKPKPKPNPKPRPEPMPDPKPRSTNGDRAPRARRDETDGVLLVARESDVWHPDDDPSGEGLPITQLSMSGNIAVIHDDYPVNLLVRMFDITEGEDTELRYPILCSIPELHDENGCFEFVTQIHIPYSMSTMDDYAVCAIPDFDLTLARRGRRRIIAYVIISEAYDLESAITYGSLEFDMVFDRVGFLEWEQHALEQEQHLVQVFVAASAIDGSIEKVEIDAIKEFFSGRYEGRDDASKWKSKATQALKSAVGDLKEGRILPGALMTSATKAIVASDEPEVVRTAFEVALRAVAADGVVNTKEEKLLTKLAASLALEESVVQGLRDRILRTSMFHGAEEDVVLGMPSGLDSKGKRKWLSAEYGKWRGRVSSSDPEIAAEAAMRLERIARLRATLS